MCEYLDIDEQKRFKIVSRMNGWTEEEFTLRDLQDPGQTSADGREVSVFPGCAVAIFFLRTVCKVRIFSKIILVFGGIR